MCHLSVAPAPRLLTVYIPIDTHNQTKNAATPPLSDPDDTSPDLGVAVTAQATAKGELTFNIFCKASVQSFPALMRNLMYKFVCSWMIHIIILLSNLRLTVVQYQSPMRKYRYNCLFKCIVLFLLLLLLFVLSVLLFC